MARFFRDAHGATAVEFGLVALPFFALLGALVQVAFTIWAQQNLDFNFQRAIRQVFTGQFQSSNSQKLTDQALLTLLGNQLCSSGSMVIFDCKNVHLDVSLASSFANGMPAYPINASTKDWNSGFGTNYSCAAPGSIVVATAAVKFPVFFRLWNPMLANFSDGSKLLESTAVFRTEPYTTDGSSPC